jgi:hypothetical protein
MYLSTMAEETTGRDHVSGVVGWWGKERGKRTLQEVGLETARHRPREQRLASSGRAVEEYALRRLDANP